METPVYLCGTHARRHRPPRRGARLGARARGHRHPGRRRVRRLLARRLAHGHDRRRRPRAARRSARRSPRASVGAGTGMMCFDFPGGIGTASRRRRRAPVGVLLLCNFGDREYLDLLGTTLDPPATRPAPAGSCIAVCATDAPMGAAPAAAHGAAAAARARRASAPTRAEGSGEIGLAFSTGGAGDLRQRRPRPVSSSPPGRRPRRPSTTASSPPARRALRDGTMQDAFPVELVRELAAARGRDDRSPRRGARPRPGPDPHRHVEPARPRDDRRRAARRLPEQGGGRGPSSSVPIPSGST